MTDPIDPYAEELSSAPSKSIDTSSRLVSPFSVVIVAVVVLFAGVIGYGIYQNDQDTIDDGPAPDFTLLVYDDASVDYTVPDLQMDYAREEIKLSQFEGDRVVVLNFWHSTCIPCREEADTLVKVYNEYRDRGVVLIGINIKDPDKEALKYLAEYNVNYPNGLDRHDKIADTYRTTGYPETFIIDLDGEIQRHFPGPVTETTLIREIEKALEKAS